MNSTTFAALAATCGLGASAGFAFAPGVATGAAYVVLMGLSAFLTVSCGVFLLMAMERAARGR